MKKKKPEVFDDSFYRLAEEVTRTIANNKDDTDQQQQVEELLDAEKKFKETVLRYRQSGEIYKKFLQKICITNKNILSARPYFRETAVNFSKKVTPAIKERNVDLLKTFDINYQFIKFIRDSWLGPFPKRAEQLFNRVHNARKILIENNMPLAINRAKLFYRKTPRSHLTLMDLIGICGMGLVAGIDKWCGPYSRVFRSVCIGRMVGNMIDLYSETTLHFYPQDRRILYKANTIRGRQGIEELNELTDAINNSFNKDKEEGKSIPKDIVTVGNLSMLMSAASPVSADATVNDEGYGVYSYVPDEEQDIEGSYIQRESISQMLSLAKKLPILHKKVLQLFGIKI
jgi:DNA-directed RNA polymerase specialized sigma subunit